MAELGIAAIMAETWSRDVYKQVELGISGGEHREH